MINLAGFAFAKAWLSLIDFANHRLICKEAYKIKAVTMSHVDRTGFYR